MATDNPKISVIVPVYNVEKYLPRCIDSILAQTFTDFELLLIDDGSTDNSGKICDEYAKKDSRIWVFHKKNRGVSSARNMGIDKAKGEWICFVDSDDWLDINFLSTVLEDSQMADITFYGCKWQYINKSVTCYLPHDFFSADKNEIEQYLYSLKYNPQKFEYLGYTWNKMFRASIIKENSIRFADKLKIREDEVFTLAYCRYIKSLRIKSRANYNYRVLLSGLTHSSKKPYEYVLLADCLIPVMKSYQSKDLLSVEYNSIFNHLFKAVMTENILRKTWLNYVMRLSSFYDSYAFYIDRMSNMKAHIIFHKKPFIIRFGIILLVWIFFKRFSCNIR